MRFLFWNVRRNSVGQILSDLARVHDVEVIILAECSDERAVLRDLNRNADPLFRLTDSANTRVLIYTRFPREFISSEYHDDFLTIRKLALTGRTEILLVAATFLARDTLGTSINTRFQKRSRRKSV